ncbi:hypothetical protein ACJX0J_036563, partial [Zea mays]
SVLELFQSVQFLQTRMSCCVSDHGNMAAVSIMRKVDRPPTNSKCLIIESSQECFSVDIPCSTDMADPTNTPSDGDPPQHRKTSVAAAAKNIAMPNVDDDDDFEPPKKKCNISMDAPNKTQ